MSRLLVLVANDPRLAREAIAVALHEVRPDVDTIAVDPAALATDIGRYHPDLAICSDHNVLVEATVPSWVLLDPGGSNGAVTSIVGVRQEMPHLTFRDLVSVVDQAARLVS